MTVTMTLGMPLATGHVEVCGTDNSCDPSMNRCLHRSSSHGRDSLHLRLRVCICLCFRLCFVAVATAIAGRIISAKIRNRLRGQSQLCSAGRS